MCNVKEGCFSNLIDSPAVTSYVTTRDIGLEQLQEVIQGHVVELGQTHSANVCLLPEISTNYFLKNTPFKSYDAVITDQPGVFLTIRTADCLPILIFHDSGVVAAVHAGRKGTDLFVLKNTLSKMKSSFSCSNGRFYIWFGPKICFSCYQINKEIDLYYNLYHHNFNQLKASLDERSYRLISSPFCTKCHNHMWYSYRLEGAEAGRIYSLIGLNKSII